MSNSTRLAAISDLRFGVHDVARRPGALRRLHHDVMVSGMAAGGVGVADGDPVEVDVRLEGVAKGLVVEGFLSGRWTAECSRCLTEVVGPFAVEVQELFEDEAVEGDTYRLQGDEIDIEPLVRDAVLLSLPNAPLCTDDCAGLCAVCGTDRNLGRCACSTDTSDPRWAALAGLRFDPQPEPAAGDS